MRKHVFMAIAASITCLFVMMLLAQAGRFDTKESVDRPEDKSSGFRAPYHPMPLKPIYY
jgi:hypothetical protein